MSTTDTGIPTLPEQCCERDHDHDGNCDRHPAPIVPIPEASRTRATLGRVLHCYAVGGYRQKAGDPDQGPRPGMVVREYPREMPVANIKVLFDDNTDLSEPSGTLPACPVYDELTPGQRDLLRVDPAVSYWAEWPPRR